LSEYGRSNYDSSEEGIHTHKEQNMTEPMTEYAKNNTCQHGVVASRCQECLRDSIIKQQEVARRAQALHNLQMSKGTTEETTGVQCKHSNVLGKCSTCIEDLLRHTHDQDVSRCYHGNISNECKYCVSLDSLKEHAIVNRKNNNVLIVKLLKMAIDILEKQ